LPYPSDFDPSLAALDSSRPARRAQEIARLGLDEKQALLEAHHPDFRPHASGRLRVGPNAGDRAPRELVALMESPSRLDPEAFPVEPVDAYVDVLVIGGGGAGSAAALAAHQAGAAVLLTTKLRYGDSNTIMAEGGIAAATRPDDSPLLHYADTMKGGRFENVPELVEALVLEAPPVVRWLEELGVLFDRQADDTILTHTPGGHSRPRSHSCRDLTGLELMRVLRDEICTAGIEIWEYCPAVELLLDEEGRCAGAVLLDMDTSTYRVVQARRTVLATGGVGRLHIQDFPTSNHYGATADGLALAYRAGARMAFLDSVQYHPTGVVWPEQMFGLLVTEHLRAKGAQLVNVRGERFVNELETRDTVAAAIIRQCQTLGHGIGTPGGSRGVWLDTPLIDTLHGAGTFEHQFAGIRSRFLRFGIDPAREPILVFPTQHYHNGGVLIDVHGRTGVPYLYAAGEVCGGVHGRNRLGANSLVDLFVFGRRAGRHAASAEGEPGAPGLGHVRAFHAALAELEREGERAAPILLPDYRRPARRA
jgi:succinate dehydrogenase / fumarate reductase flavoprotein subunit